VTVARSQTAADVTNLLTAPTSIFDAMGGRPWEGADGKKGAPTSYYPPMGLEEPCALPVKQVAADDAFLFLWCPAAGLEEHRLHCSVHGVLSSKLTQSGTS